ncbi:hypothetical protein B0T19DRAFT_428136 [Cercophora scortea]|uniref:Secreted protein n=1 Tax=Cercophora scortea TaxID=314031 RepID=A0AAE0M9C0_9PEZI|nr:hypothetical protein B0T19DRAFT_428136 [Cercophora scortea]
MFSGLRALATIVLLLERFGMNCVEQLSTNGGITAGYSICYQRGQEMRNPQTPSLSHTRTSQWTRGALSVLPRRLRQVTSVERKPVCFVF